MRVAVCDDNEVMLDFLEKEILGCFSARGIEPVVEKFSLGGEFLAAHKVSPFDAVFLDIKMPGQSGFDIAAQIRRFSEKTYIIFVTTESELVYDSFNFHPFHFIPKSSPEQISAKLRGVVNSLAARFELSRLITLKLPYSEEISFIPAELVCLKSNGNYTEYCFNGKEPVRLRQKLDKAMENLNSELFLRPHKSFAVNLGFVRKISFPKLLIYLSDGSEIPISKPNKAAVEEHYSRYLRNFGGGA